MSGFCRVRDGLRDGGLSFRHLDAAQLVKHAFGLRTSVHKAGPAQGLRPVLVYLFAEPVKWPDGRQIREAEISAHRREAAEFACLVEGDEVSFLGISYRRSWTSGDTPTTVLFAHTQMPSWRTSRLVACR